MFTSEQILTVLISAGIPVFLWWLNKRKQQVEIESIVLNQMAIVNSAKDGEIKRLTAKVESNEETIKRQNQINEKQAKENEECKYNSVALKLQVRRLKQIVDFNGYEWEKIYVLDDNPMVTQGFEFYFTEAGIQMAVFNEVEGFISDVNKHQPCVLIIDNYLGEVQAKDVIKRLTYKPEIILMSADVNAGDQFEGQRIRFFPKTENYIYKIAQAVIEYLSNKN